MLYSYSLLSYVLMHQVYSFLVAEDRGNENLSIFVFSFGRVTHHWVVEKFNLLNKSLYIYSTEKTFLLEMFSSYW